MVSPSAFTLLAKHSKICYLDFQFEANFYLSLVTNIRLVFMSTQKTIMFPLYSLIYYLILLMQEYVSAFASNDPILI